MKGKNSNRGNTLIELVVTFALVGIFLVAAVSVLSSAVIMHSELTGAMYAQNVGELLLDKVTGELAGAKPKGSPAIVIGDASAAGATAGNGAAFYDRNDEPVRCMVQDGLLVFQNDVSGDWRLDEKAYMGFRITDMQIARLKEGNVIEVTFQIKNLKTGLSYSASRCTRCYNFTTKEDCQKISEGKIM